jgi:ribosomal-protein-alanine N-acetyltransferase
MQADRIRLIPHTLEHLRALVAGSGAYEGQFGFRVADGVAAFLTGPEVSPAFLERLEASTVSDPWRDGFGILHLTDNRVIGLCSYGGPPGADGIVEISYGIVPAYEGRGHATEAARTLIAQAFASGSVQALRAHTLPEHNASTKVLAKCRFEFIEEITHPEDGLIWRWELRPDEA